MWDQRDSVLVGAGVVGLVLGWRCKRPFPISSADELLVEAPFKTGDLVVCRMGNSRSSADGASLDPVLLLEEHSTVFVPNKSLSKPCWSTSPAVGGTALVGGRER